MVNFAERIAYWYLRLNGFFLVEDFVLHRGEEIKDTADADLLGIRLKNSFESIDNKPLEPCETLKKQLGDFASHVALVVQIKSGQKNNPGESFALNRLQYALQFMGVVPDHKTDEIAKALKAKKSYNYELDWLVAKLFISENPNCGTAINITLDCALSFIKKRLETHSDVKSGSRMFFPDELMQYLAWRSTQPNKQRLCS